jgi:hypothetical protein
MKLYRFAVHPEEDGFLFLECINDPKLFTQARSMDEALLMARDVVECMYEVKGALIEFVIPPDVVTSYEKRRHAQSDRKAKARQRKSALAAKRASKRAA